MVHTCPTPSATPKTSVSLKSTYRIIVRYVEYCVYVWHGTLRYRNTYYFQNNHSFLFFRVNNLWNRSRSSSEIVETSPFTASYRRGVSCPPRASFCMISIYYLDTAPLKAGRRKKLSIYAHLFTVLAKLFIYSSSFVSGRVLEEAMVGGGTSKTGFSGSISSSIVRMISDIMLQYCKP